MEHIQTWASINRPRPYQGILVDGMAAIGVAGFVLVCLEGGYLLVQAAMAII